MPKEEEERNEGIQLVPAQLVPAGMASRYVDTRSPLVDVVDTLSTTSRYIVDHGSLLLDNPCKCMTPLGGLVFN